MTERIVAATVHGRYLVDEPADGPRDGTPTLIGFHGYAETAEAQLERLRLIPGVERWRLVSVQGLHAFYRGRSQEIGASWMTRLHRELAIADNLAYVAMVVDAVSPGTGPLVFAGFSQGVAMAFRAAVASTHPVSGVLAVGGDVPPEIDRAALGRTVRALVGRGERDEWYSQEILARDVARLREAGVDVQLVEFDGGHEWPAAYAQEAAGFLARLIAR